jgi:hypothetical protein
VRGKRAGTNVEGDNQRSLPISSSRHDVRRPRRVEVSILRSRDDTSRRAADVQRGEIERYISNIPGISQPCAPADLRP